MFAGAIINLGYIMEIKLFDTHCHLDLIHKKNPALSIRELWQRARDAGVSSICQIGIDFESSREALQIASKNPATYASIGLHPSEEITQNEIEKVIALAHENKGNKKFIALGETGLDYHWIKDTEKRKTQMTSLEMFLDLAVGLDKTLIIHCRPSDGKDALDDLYPFFSNCRKLPRVIMHCFAGDKSYARKYQDLGCYLSFTGNVTFKNAEILRESLKEIQPDRLLIETDAPYLAPVPKRGKLNEPSYIIHTFEFIRGLLKLDPLELADQIYHNSRMAFDLEE